MSNIKGSFVFTKIKHAIITSPKGVKCIVIPIAENKLYESSLGNISLDWIAFAKKTTEKNGETHIVKQSYKKEYLDTLTKEEKDALPIIGNAKVWGNNEGHVESAPVTNSEIADDIAAGVGDLPF